MLFYESLSKMASQLLKIVPQMRNVISHVDVWGPPYMPHSIEAVGVPQYGIQNKHQQRVSEHSTNSKPQNPKGSAVNNPSTVCFVLCLSCIQ